MKLVKGLTQAGKETPAGKSRQKLIGNCPGFNKVKAIIKPIRSQKRNDSISPGSIQTKKTVNLFLGRPR